MINIVFELNNLRSAAYDEDKLVGMAEFSASGNVWTIYHTETDQNYGGRGIGKGLIRCLVEQARKAKVKVIPQCSFAEKEFMKNAEYKDVKQD